MEAKYDTSITATQHMMKTADFSSAMQHESNQCEEQRTFIKHASSVVGTNNNLLRTLNDRLEDVLGRLLGYSEGKHDNASGIGGVAPEMVELNNNISDQHEIINEIFEKLYRLEQL